MAAEGSAARKVAQTEGRQPPVESRPRPESLDELIHQRTRLAILSALATGERLAFNDLKTILDVTDGNLSVHARKLEEAGYVNCTKRFRGRTPLTEYELTAEGRSALESYLSHMESIIQAARDAGP